MRTRCYRRSATLWHHIVDSLGRRIEYVTSDEATVQGVGICSIHDPADNTLAYRLLADGTARPLSEDDGPHSPHGLVVLGTSKFDRPSLEEVRKLSHLRGDIAADAVRACLDARERGRRVGRKGSTALAP